MSQAVFPCLILILGWLGCSSTLNAGDLPDRLRQTHLINLQAVVDEPSARAQTMEGFSVANPYPDGDTPTHQEQIGQIHPMEICAVIFRDSKRQEYELRTFSSPDEAEQNGAIVTHFGRCGTCSTLSDLAVYLGTHDLTTPARRCARKWGARRVKQCFMEQVGFTEACAESWTYNVLNTRAHCRSACVDTYGLLNLILHRYPALNNLPDGSVNACLQCDEDVSGPGFKASAGRTRRNSGIKSAIDRGKSEILPVDHGAYFED